MTTRLLHSVLLRVRTRLLAEVADLEVYSLASALRALAWGYSSALPVLLLVCLAPVSRQPWVPR